MASWVFFYGTCATNRASAPRFAPPHQVLPTSLCRYGFNAGSTQCFFGCMPVAARVAVNTTLSAGEGCLPASPNCLPTLQRKAGWILGTNLLHRWPSERRLCRPALPLAGADERAWPLP